jgi:SAM-dependent methyltransferase
LTESWSEKYRSDGLSRAALDRAAAVASLQETRRLVRPGMRVLEAGSGTGRLSVALAACEAVDVVGADSSAGSVQTSRLLLEQIDGLTGTCEFVEADLYRLPFEDRSFDVVFSDSVWEHLDHPRDALAEVVRVLRPGGWFVFTTPNRWRPDGWDLYRTLARPSYRQESYSPFALRALAADAGLEPVRIFGDELWLERNVALLRAAARARLSRMVGGSSPAPGTGGASAPRPPRATPASKLRPPLRRLVQALLPRWLRIHVGVIAKRP